MAPSMLYRRRRCLPSRCVRPAPPATEQQAGLHPSHEVGVDVLGAPIAPWAGPSAGSRCAARRGGLKDLSGRHGLSAAAGFTAIAA